MDQATNDLRCFQLARQLEMVPQLFEVFERNNFLYPMFYGAVDMGARGVARTILLSLRRWLGYREQFTHNFVDPLKIFNLSRHILSFLEFPHLHSATLPRSKTAIGHLTPKLLSSPSSAVGEGTPGTGIQESSPPSFPSQQQTPSKGLAAGGEEDRGALVTAEHTPARLSTATAAKGTPHGGVHSNESLLTGPSFSVRPPSKRGGYSAAPCLFVRMIHTQRLNQETMNPYFGRYGQTDCEVLQRITLLEADLGVRTTKGLCQLHESSADLLYIQDFIISVDSYRNAMNAVEQAYYKELLFIAFHDRSGPDTNAFTIADMDTLLADSATVYMADLRILAPPKKERPVKRARSRSGSKASSSSSSLSSSSSSSSSFDDDAEGFVPEILIDGFPYYCGEDQIKILLRQWGDLVSLRLSIDDRSGAFTGAVLAGYATVEEALNASQEANGYLYLEQPLVAGVLNEHMELVSLADGEVLVPAPHDFISGSGTEILMHHQLWV